MGVGGGFIRDKVRGPARILRGDTCNCQGGETLWQMSPGRGGCASGPEAVPPGSAQAASGPRARGSLLPPGAGTWAVGEG